MSDTPVIATEGSAKATSPLQATNPLPDTIKPPEATQTLREAFLTDIAANPNDMATRLIFADFLEDNGELELAELYRGKAKEWLMALAVERGIDPNYDKHYDFEAHKYIDLPDPTPEESYNKLVEQVVGQWGEEYIVIMGTEWFRNNMVGSEIEEMFWRCIGVVTGRDPNTTRHSEWSCSC